MVNNENLTLIGRISKSVFIFSVSGRKDRFPELMTSLDAKFREYISFVHFLVKKVQNLDLKERRESINPRNRDGSSERPRLGPYRPIVWLTNISREKFYYYIESFLIFKKSSIIISNFP